MLATKLLPLKEKYFSLHIHFLLDLLHCLGQYNIMTGKELKEWRSKNGITQMELSKFLGVTWSTVARWEIGVRPISPYLHLALATIARNLKKKGGETRYAMREKKKKKVGN